MTCPADTPTYEDVVDIINRLNNTAPGEYIVVILLQYNGNTFQKDLCIVMFTIGVEDKIPNQWKKPGSSLDSYNYLVMLLLQHSYKVFLNFIFNKLLPIAEIEIGTYEVDFSGGGSTFHQLFR